MKHILVLGFILQFLGATSAQLVNYCPPNFCIAPKLGEVAVNDVKFECYNKETYATQPVTTVDPTQAVVEQLVSTGYTNLECVGVSSGSNCNSHGKFNPSKRICDCLEGWSGHECANRPCPNKCNDHGYCHDDICYCFAGFKGAACELTDCPQNCNGHGRCVAGACQCYPGFTGDTCDTETCKNDCSFHGECVAGACLCDNGYFGDDCSVKTCPNNCFNSVDRGFCTNGQCACSSSWSGPSCEIAQCPNKCSGNGKCDTGTGVCKCDIGYTGVDCSQPTCPTKCGEHGKCGGLECVCDPGYTGPTCTPACPFNCSGDGVCSLVGKEFKCFCNKGKTGEHCEYSTCPSDCSGHGTCDSKTDRCVCTSGWMGFDCSLPMCHGGPTGSEGLCSGNGYCEDSGICQCAEGWKGEKCNRAACLNSCSNHGACSADVVCICDAGYSGDDCSTKVCPSNCSNAGHCNSTGTSPKCECFEGFEGFDCSIKTCPNNCSGNGICVKGICYCQGEFIGEDCSQKPCGDCSGHGTCDPVNSTCKCTEGWIGAICQTKVCEGYPKKECSSRGVCIEGQCFCAVGYSGSDCSQSCPSAYDGDKGLKCTGHGKCGADNKCQCEPGWAGTMCSEKTCPSQCSGHGICNNGTCVCDSKRTGDECEIEVVEPEAVVSGLSSICECSMNCTVLCLRHCAGVHDKYGMFMAHQCFSNCKQSCAVGCAVHGTASVDHFDLESSVTAGLRKTPITGSKALAEAILVQAEKMEVEQQQDSLPTMDL